MSELVKRATVRYGMDSAEYHGDSASLNATTMKRIVANPRKARYLRDNPKPATDAMTFGTAYHTLALEPDTFPLRYSTGPSLAGLCDDKGKPYANPAASNAGKAIVAKWIADNPGVTVLSTTDLDRLCAMRDALKAEPTIAEWFDNPAFAREASIFWTDADGIDLRARLDFVLPPRSPLESVVIGDLKTCAKLTDDAIRYAAADLGYHLSLAHYKDACKALWPENEVIVCVVWQETEAPYQAHAQVADDLFLEAGDKAVRKAKRIWRETDGLTAENLPGAELSTVLTLPRNFRAIED